MNEKKEEVPRHDRQLLLDPAAAAVAPKEWPDAREEREIEPLVLIAIIENVLLAAMGQLRLHVRNARSCCHSDI